MRKKYFLNKNTQRNGDHEVHTEDCSYIPEPVNRIFLGTFETCYEAVIEAKMKYPQYTRINGCYYCSTTCHTS